MRHHNTLTCPRMPVIPFPRISILNFFSGVDLPDGPSFSCPLPHVPLLNLLQSTSLNLVFPGVNSLQPLRQNPYDCLKKILHALCHITWQKMQQSLFNIPRFDLGNGVQTFLNLISPYNVHFSVFAIKCSTQKTYSHVKML